MTRSVVVTACWVVAGLVVACASDSPESGKAEDPGRPGRAPIGSDGAPPAVPLAAEGGGDPSAGGSSSGGSGGTPAERPGSGGETGGVSTLGDPGDGGGPPDRPDAAAGAPPESAGGAPGVERPDGSVGTSTGGAIVAGEDASTGIEFNIKRCCEGLPSGTYCGGNLRPEGDGSTRYFCSGDRTLAAAICPASCDASTRECTGSAGPAQDDPAKDTLRAFRCPACYDGLCAVPAERCHADEQCTAQEACFLTCDTSTECLLACNAAFPRNPAFDALLLCIQSSRCRGVCPP
jgi:hypothetical protein